MKVKFWGVRGSIASPGMATARYGGNTTCIEVRTDDGNLVVFDGGTGIRPLGLELLKNLPVQAQVFISHTHWDHIQGFPFFIPAYSGSSVMKIYGTNAEDRKIFELLHGQMQDRSAGFEARG